MTRRNKGDEKPRHTRVPLNKLEADPDLFQHRTVKLDNAHAEALVHVLSRGETLDPLTAWVDDRGQLIVVDGHHRLEAYRRANWTKGVPVVIHSGPEENAQFLAMSDNGKQRLQMTQEEKSNWAWRMVRDYPELTAKRIAEGPVSLRQVRNMRSTMRRLEQAGEALPDTWGMAMVMDKGNAGEWDEAQREERRVAMRAKLLEQIRAHLSLAAQRDPDMALEVVEEVMGRSRFEIAADALGYRKMTQAEIEGDDLPF
ncbi:ParB N-terminal domain-containing protein [Leisingera sp. JC11]|uniref:ParB N-terminal domain-containing protein n=1 Tax=Leisingera sp. JC11 TaxID=3042469 RepID=UPI003452F83E